jgi:hypothetical protein
MERAPVGEQNFNAAALRAQPFASKERHVQRRRVGLTVTFQNGRAIDVRDVRRWICRDRLARTSRGCLRPRVRRE